CSQAPNPLLVQKILASQGADGAEVNNIGGQLVINRLIGEDVDLGVMAPVDDLQLSRAGDLARKADAARAHNATIGEERNIATEDGFVRRRILFIDHPGFGVAELVAEVL